MKIDRTVSHICDICKIPKGTEHCLFHCNAYREEISDHQRTVKDILNGEELNAIIDINLKVYIGCINDICWQGENDLVKSTKLFF